MTTAAGGAGGPGEAQGERTEAGPSVENWGVVCLQGSSAIFG